MYSLCQRCRPRPASRRACSLVSARWNDIRTRQPRRSTSWPCLAAASSAKLHWVGNAWSPSVVFDPIEITPRPCLPAKVMPEGLIMDAVVTSRVSCKGRICSCASRNVNQSLSWLKRSAPRSSARITPSASS